MSTFEAESRDQARACGRVGFKGFALAFNATNDPENAWRYSREVRERFEELCTELLGLIETGRIEKTPGHAHLVAAREARKNPALQTLIRKASRKTPIRG